MADALMGGTTASPAEMWWLALSSPPVKVAAAALVAGVAFLVGFRWPK